MCETSEAAHETPPKLCVTVSLPCSKVHKGFIRVSLLAVPFTPCNSFVLTKMMRKEGRGKEERGKGKKDRKGSINGSWVSLRVSQISPLASVIQLPFANRNQKTQSQCWRGKTVGIFYKEANLSMRNYATSCQAVSNVDFWQHYRYGFLWGPIGSQCWCTFKTFSKGTSQWSTQV